LAFAAIDSSTLARVAAVNGRCSSKSVWVRGEDVRPMTVLPAACSFSQLIGPYMLSMSTTMWSASASGTSCQRPPELAFASAKAVSRSAWVAGSMPVRPRVRGIVRGPRPEDEEFTCYGPAMRSRCSGSELARVARQVAFQECHLVGQDVAIAQDQVFDPAWAVGDRQQRHPRLLRGPVALARVAMEAGADHVLPDVAPALGQRHDVVTGELGP